MDTDFSDLSFSAIIPVKNQSGLLYRLLNSLDENAPRRYLKEIIVVDDCSDEFIEPILRPYSRVHYVRLEQGGGPAAARNTGAEIASFPILFFFDADVICPLGLFEKTAALFEEYPECSAVSFFNQDYDPHAGYIANYHSLMEDYWFSSLVEPQRDVGFVRGFTTRGGAILKSAFEKIHGFDERYKTNAHEDYDFGKRLSAQSTILLTRTPIVYHSYPLSFYRLLRNVWIRTIMFIPYYLAHHPKLDTVQVSRWEALLRMMGVCSGALACLMILPVPFRLFGLLIAFVGLTGYFFSVSKLLKHAWLKSGRVKFVFSFLAIHYISSVVIVAAAGLSLTKSFFINAPQDLLSPIESSKTDRNQRC